MSLRTRFPPSPTGSLHVGGARAAIFDREKLRWLSSRYVQARPPPELTRRLAPVLGRQRFQLPHEALSVAAAALRERISVLREVNERL